MFGLDGLLLAVMAVFLLVLFVVGVFILKLDEATLPTAVAQGFPFAFVQFAKRLGAPEWFACVTQTETSLALVMDLPEKWV